MGQALLQSRSTSHYYKVGKDLLKSQAGSLLKNRAGHFSETRTNEEQSLLIRLMRFENGRGWCKTNILQTYYLHNFDVIFFPETYLDSNILPNDDNLQITGYPIQGRSFFTY